MGDVMRPGVDAGADAGADADVDADAGADADGGEERAGGPIPVGLEHVLALAAAHSEFRAALRRDPGAALNAASLELSPTERAIFAAASEASLDQMIGQVDAGLPQPERRQFLERATVAVAVLLGGSALVGCDKDTNEYGKPSSSGPPRTPARPTQPVQVQSNRPLPPGHGSMGARPNREPGSDSMEAMASTDPRDAMDAMDKAPPPPTRPSAAEAMDGDAMDAMDAMDEDGKKRPRPAQRRRRRRRRPRQPRPASMGIRPHLLRTP